MNYYDYLTDFIFREDQPDQAELIMIPGNRYGELAFKAAELYHEGYANKIVVSGKYSTLKNEFDGPMSPEEYKNKRYNTECDFYTDILINQGVEPENIIQERQASFTFENAIYTRKLLSEMGMTADHKKVILVCQAFHAKRSLMYYQLVFPDTEFLMCPAVTQNISRDNWFLDERKIDVVLGEVERCGVQFKDILTGRDQVLNRIIKGERS